MAMYPFPQIRIALPYGHSAIRGTSMSKSAVSEDRILAGYPKRRLGGVAERAVGFNSDGPQSQ